MSRRVNLTRVFCLGGVRISRDATSAEWMPKRASVPGPCFEDPGQVSYKGPYETTGNIQGIGTASTSVALSMLSGADPVWLLEPLDGNPESSPIAAAGSPAFFCRFHVGEVQTPFARAALNTFTLPLSAAEGLPFFGKVAYTNAGSAVLGAGDVTSTPVQLGVLGAGQVLALLVMVLDQPPLGGTSPTVDVDLESDALVGFASPIVRASAAQITASPGVAYVEVDGDTDPVPGEPWWRVKISVGGTDPEATVLVAFCLRSKT